MIDDPIDNGLTAAFDHLGRPFSARSDDRRCTSAIRQPLAILRDGHCLRNTNKRSTAIPMF